MTEKKIMSLRGVRAWTSDAGTYIIDAQVEIASPYAKTTEDRSSPLLAMTVCIFSLVFVCIGCYVPCCFIGDTP